MPGGSTRRRFARRQWSRRWARLRRLLLVVVLLGLVAGAAWLVFVSSVLAAERVTVSGTRTVTQERISAAAGVPIGEPLARVDVDRLRARVESVPVVERADISRSWPHTVAIAVTERTPVGSVRTGGSYRLIDAHGVMYRTVPRPAGRLPVMQVADTPGVAQEAAAVAASLPSGLTKRVREIRATTLDSIELRLRDGRSVVWGSADSSALKADVLGSLLKRDASEYDVSVPGAPTVKVG